MKLKSVVNLETDKIYEAVRVTEKNIDEVLGWLIRYKDVAVRDIKCETYFSIEAELKREKVYYGDWLVIANRSYLYTYVKRFSPEEFKKTFRKFGIVEVLFGKNTNWSDC